jgi:hypothetical protein
MEEARSPVNLVYRMRFMPRPYPLLDGIPARRLL